jgi:hypothetical protein
VPVRHPSGIFVVAAIVSQGGAAALECPCFTLGCRSFAPAGLHAVRCDLAPDGFFRTFFIHVDWSLARRFNRFGGSWLRQLPYTPIVVSPHGVYSGNEKAFFLVMFSSSERCIV